MSGIGLQQCGDSILCLMDSLEPFDMVSFEGSIPSKTQLLILASLLSHHTDTPVQTGNRIGKSITENLASFKTKCSFLSDTCGLFSFCHVVYTWY